MLLAKCHSYILDATIAEALAAAALAGIMDLHFCSVGDFF
jgi:hypothetical protein